MKCLCFFFWLEQARMIPGLLLVVGNLTHAQAQSGWQQAAAPTSVSFRSALNFRGTPLAGTDGAGVYRREAAGRWIAEEPADSMGVVKALLTHNGQVFAIGSDAVWMRREDQRWLSILPLPDADSELLGICSSGDKLYLGWTYGMLRSDDSGRSWKEGGGQLEGKAIHALAGWRDALWAVAEGSVYRSDDGGQIWHPDNNGLPLGQRELSLQAVGDSLYLLDAQFGLFVYTDGLWRRQEIPGGVRAMLEYEDDQYAAGETGVYKRVGKRGAWLHLNGFPASVSAATVLIHVNNGILLGTNHQGCWQLPDSQSAAMQEETGIANTRISSLAVQDGQWVLTTRFAGSLHTSHDKGKNWQRLYPEAFPPLDATLHRSAGSLHWLGTSAGLWLSRDKGQTWSEIPLFRRQRIHDILQTSDGWLVAGMAGTVFKTTDTGMSWQFAGKGFQRPGVYQLMQLGNTLFAASYGGLYRSLNGGNDWMKTDSGLPAWEAAAHIAAVNGVLYLSTFESGLFWSHDSGHSFEQLHHQFSEWSVRKIVGEGNLLFATDGIKVYFSADFGLNWKALPYGLPYRTNIADLCLSDGFCLAATEGKGLWRLAIASAAAGDFIQHSVGSCQLWPVPAANQVHIRLPLPRTQYQIADMAGRIWRNGQASGRETSIDLHGLPSGNYTLRWFSGKGGGAQLFVKQ